MSELSDENKEAYKSLYCSVCYSIKGKYGRKSTLFIQHDLLFLLLCTDISFSPICAECTLTKKNCVAFPLKKVNTLSYSNHSYELLGDLSVFTIYTAYLNKLVDNKSSKRNAIFSKLYKKEWKKSASRLGISDRDIQQLLEILEAEKNTEKMPDQMIEPMCVFYAQLIGRHLGEKAEQIAYHMCQIMYYLDALEDYYDDLKKGNFNILKSVYMSPEQSSKYVNKKVLQSLAVIQSQTTQSNNQEMIHNIILKSIINKLNTIQQAHTKLATRGELK